MSYAMGLDAVSDPLPKIKLSQVPTWFWAVTALKLGAVGFVGYKIGQRKKR